MFRSLTMTSVQGKVDDGGRGERPRDEWRSVCLCGEWPAPEHVHTLDVCALRRTQAYMEHEFLYMETQARRIDD